MRGMDALIAVRRSGKKPIFVYVQTDDTPLYAGGDVMVTIGADEPVARLDLRALIGLHVIVEGSDERRVSEVGAAVIAAGATRTQCVTYERHGERSEIVSNTDTAGGYAWHRC